MLDEPPLQRRRKVKRLVTFYKATNNLSTVQIMSLPPPTRTHNLGLHADYEQYKNSFLTQTIRELMPFHETSADFTHSRQNNHMFLTVNTEFLTMLMTSLARDADALGRIK